MGQDLRQYLINHRPKTIGIIAELDSLSQPAHKYADPETGAAQA